MRWWWVRHAPTRATGFCGWSDPPADIEDGQTLAALRSALPEEAALLTSDLQRAVQTADAIERRTWRRAPPIKDLREQNFGDWEGAPHNVAPADDPFWRDPAHTAPPGGESYAELIERVRGVVDGHVDLDSEDVVVVAHAGVVRAAIAVAIGLPPASALGFEVAPLSITRIDYLRAAQAWRIAAVNIGY